ncbi:MAG: NADH-quinone oxidoreductase subunit D [Deltaproteobacteria bacterium]|nr:NADH-quinone oxidoreductase subunit D [Deltaproteobacteria bacterium]
MLKTELKHLKPQVHTFKEEMILNMGPQHPSTHGVLNFLVVTDGEVIHQALPNVGYLHRGIEKLAEQTPYTTFIPFTDRIDYLAAMFANHVYVLAVENLADIEVPERAQFLRVIACELNRIASHLISTGALALDIGASTPFVHWIRERECINDIMESICGARLTYSYMRVGGVSQDINEQIADDIYKFLDHFEPIIDEYNRLISFNEIFIKRLANVAIISPVDAVNFGLVGPNLRGSGIEMDIRRTISYSVYDQFDFNIPIGKGFKGSLGDCYDRYFVRVLEMTESCSIIRQALSQIPKGDIKAKVKRKLKIKENECYTCVESARGEMGMYLLSDGSDRPYRLKIKTGSFTAMSIVEKVSQGLMVADLIALIGSLDVVAPEIDR